MMEQGNDIFGNGRERRPSPIEPDVYQCRQHRPIYIIPPERDPLIRELKEINSKANKFEAKPPSADVFRRELSNVTIYPKGQDASEGRYGLKAPSAFQPTQRKEIMRLGKGSAFEDRDEERGKDFWNVVMNTHSPVTHSPIGSETSDPCFVSPYSRHPCSTPQRSSKRAALNENSAFHVGNPIPPAANSSQERPFKCSKCPKAFKRKYDLKQHVSAVEEKKRPFGCSECQYKAGHSGTLNKHIRVVHRGLKRFICPTCLEKFSERGNLNKHMWKKHNVQRMGVTKRRSVK